MYCKGRLDCEIGCCLWTGLQKYLRFYKSVFFPLNVGLVPVILFSLKNTAINDYVGNSLLFYFPLRTFAQLYNYLLNFMNGKNKICSKNQFENTDLVLLINMPLNLDFTRETGHVRSVFLFFLLCFFFQMQSLALIFFFSPFCEGKSLCIQLIDAACQ